MGSKRKKRKVLPNGRNETEGQFLPLPYSMIQSAAFRSLSGGALKVFLEVRTRFNGKNNGRLSLSSQQAADLLGMSKSTISRAFKELQDKGFLKLRTKGQWYGRKASEFIATDKSFDGFAPTRDWQNWKPPKQKTVPARNRETRCDPDEYRDSEFASQEDTRHSHLKVVHGAR